MSTDKIKDHGYVVRWNQTYGFIRPDGSQLNDVYVNFRNVKDREQIAHGSRVAYHLAPDQRHPDKVMAVDVEIIRP